MADDFTINVKRFDPEDPRLGRHVVHDSRSLRYRFHGAVKDPRKLASVRHEIKVPILDQLDVGSCTGHAGTANLGGPEFWRAAKAVLKAEAQADHEYAVGLYSAATRLDPWTGEYLPDDTGSDGLSVAKALLARGLISGYQHATTLADALAALAEQPVMVGTSWRESMFDPDSDGRVHIDGATLGGHEYCLDEIDVERRRVWIRQSWGPGWGIEGRAWLSWEDLGTLLADQGDCTVLVPLSEPAPTPEPAPPSPPAPTPAPTPAPPAPDASAALLRGALQKFTKTSTCPKYLRTAAQEWMASGSPSNLKRSTRK